VNPKLKTFLLRWANNTVGVMVAASLVPGIRYDNLLGLVTAAFLLGILNTFIRWALILLTLPLVVVTLGLFILVINAALLYCVGYVMKSFHVDSFGAAIWGGLIIGIVSFVLNLMTGAGGWMRVRQTAPPTNRRDDDGPVIDV
jgi:putative membrane protein